MWLWLLCSTILSFQSFTRMFTGLLFLTAVSDTHPDQFVYKTLPPSIQVDKSVDVMMNSYLGLWPPEVAASGHAIFRPLTWYSPFHSHYKYIASKSMWQQGFRWRVTCKISWLQRSTDLWCISPNPLISPTKWTPLPDFFETVSLWIAVIENFNSSGEVFEKGDYHLLAPIFFLAVCIISLWALLAMSVYALYCFCSVFNVLLNLLTFIKILEIKFIQTCPLEPQ